MGFETGSSAGVRYQVKMKLMNESISVQNRMILCRAISREDDVGNVRRDEKKEVAHEKLTRAYHRAHRLPGLAMESTSKAATKKKLRVAEGFSSTLMTGFCIGAAFSFLVASRMTNK